MKTIGKLFVSIILAQSAGVVGSFVTVPAISSWYAELTKPWFSPPNWVFGPVWLLLYTLLGISFFLIWQRKGKAKRLAVTLFLVHLGLNAFWSFLFFGLHNPFLAFLEILLLLLTLLLVLWQFWRIRKAAAYLLFPYLLWVSFAAVLNFAVWQLNP